MKSYETNLLAEKIIKKLVDSGNEINNIGRMTIKHLLETDIKSEETFELPDCAWGKTHPIMTKNTIFQISSSINFSNGHHSLRPENLQEAIEIGSVKHTELKEHNDYWNNQKEIITRITTIKEVVAIIEPEDKK